MGLAMYGPASARRRAAFRTAGRATGQAHRMTQPEAYRMIERRARAASIKTKVGNHSLRATGITDYLKNAGTLAHAQAMASHSSPRTTKLFDGRADEISLDEIRAGGDLSPRTPSLDAGIFQSGENSVRKFLKLSHG